MADNLTPVLELRNVSKGFGAVQALDDVSLSVAAGEVICLVGENGAGKSTLASIVAGIYRPSRGEVFVEGKSWVFNSTRDAFAAGVRLTPQELLLATNLSVAENISMGHWPQSGPGIVSSRQLRRIAKERLGILGITELDVDARVAGLRVTDQAFTQLARALTPGAKLLIADEPTAPMSASEVGRLMEVLSTVAASGIGVVYISHRSDEVLAMASRVLVLRDGRLRDEIGKAELTKRRLVSAMLGGKDIRHDSSSRDPGPVRLDVRGLAGGELSGLDLSVRGAEIVGLYGVSGSGREAVGPLLFGAAKRRSGQIRVDGKLITGSSPRHAIAAGMAYVPAERRSQGLVMGDSVKHNATLGNLTQVSTRGVIAGSAERKLVEHWRERLDLKTPSIETLVQAMSGGTQQKVLLARWLIKQLPVLVLDEPTRGVDIATKAEIYELLRRVASEQTAVLVISGDPEELAAISDRAVVVASGRMAAELEHPEERQLISSALTKIGFEDAN